MENTALIRLFRLHDWACDFLVRHTRPTKRLLLAVAWGSFLGVAFPDARRDFGELALDILLGLLFLSPLSRLLRMRLLLIAMGFRREFGIMMGAFALVHSIGYLSDPTWVAWFVVPYLSDIPGMDPRILAGIVALLLTLPLFVTSNAFSQRVLGRNWKRLHRLAYPLLLVALLHKFIRFGPIGESVSGIIMAFIVFATYLLVRVLARNDFFPPLRNLIDSIGSRYAAYRKGVPVDRGA